MENEILNALSDQNKALTALEINDLLSLSSVEDYQAVQKALNGLVSSGKIHKTKKDKFILIENCASLKSGIIHINKRGNGFVTTDKGDVFVAKENLNSAIDGDLVEIDVQNDEGIVISILKRDLSLLVGEIVKKHNELAFELDDKKKDIHVEITASTMSRCVEGHKVLVKIIKELKPNLYLGEITKILGHKNDPGVDILSIAADHGIYLEFPEAVQREVDNLPTEVSESEIKDRRDLRNDIYYRW